jgi:GNAT superfamily N-acetyltransferase
MTIDIKKVSRGRVQRDFIALPYRLARHSPNWVLPLRAQVADLLDRKRHPFFQNADAVFFVAYRDGTPVGRIAAIEDRAHNARHDEQTLHFGFFDCENDHLVAKALFDRITQEARSRGLHHIRGPFNHSVHEEIGLQISDFDAPNFVMIPANPPYYAPLVAAQGYEKSVDLLCYGLVLADMSPAFLRRAAALQGKLGVTVRSMTKQSFDADTARLRQIYNDAWENNWPWRQASPAEFDHIVSNMRQIADLDLVLVAEDAAGQLIGFSLAVPNVNEIFARIPDGRLFPFGLIKLLWYLRPGRLRSARVLAMGVTPAWQRKGIDSLFHAKQREIGMAKGITYVELSQVLETNKMMCRAAALVGGTPRMTHRIYEKSLIASS